MKHFLAISPDHVPYMNDVYDMVRKVYARPADDPMKDLDVNIWLYGEHSWMPLSEQHFISEMTMTWIFEIGQRCGKICQKQRNAKKNKCAVGKPKLDNAWRLRGIYFIDPADAEFKELSKVRGESWKFRCQQQNLARSGEESTRELVALLMLARQNTHASLKPTSQRESVWKELCIKIMKTTLQGNESIDWTTTISCTSLFLCLKQCKCQMRKQQWAKNGKNSG